MESTKSVHESPIYISLSGDLYADKNKTMAGTLIGDHRLSALDAFLDSLSNSEKHEQGNGSCILGDALRLIVQKCHPNILAKSDLVVEVTTKLNPEKKEMSHVFRVSAKAKK